MPLPLPTSRTDQRPSDAPADKWARILRTFTTLVSIVNPPIPESLQNFELLLMKIKGTHVDEENEEKAGYEYQEL